MKLDRVNKPKDHYSGLWTWLETYVGTEGVAYYTNDEPADPSGDRWVVAEIVFADPKHETLAQLRWG